MVSGRRVRFLAGALVLASGAAWAHFDRNSGVAGKSVSPRGGWTVTSPRRLQDDIDRAPSIAYLRGPALRSRRLMGYERTLDVFWPSDGRHVILLSSTTHFSTMRIFALGPRDIFPPDRIERAIERSLAARGPRLGTIENRTIAISVRGRRPCLQIEESGLPPGQTEGSYIARKALFSLDLDKGVAMHARDCAARTPL